MPRRQKSQSEPRDDPDALAEQWLDRLLRHGERARDSKSDPPSQEQPEARQTSPRLRYVKEHGNRSRRI
jgi:hypothetical protein